MPYSIENGMATGVLIGNAKGKDFGIVSLSIPNAAFAKTGIQIGDYVDIVISLEGKEYFNQQVLYGNTFGDVPVGEPVLHNEVASYLGLALNMDSFTQKYNIEPGIKYEVLIKKHD